MPVQSASVDREEVARFSAIADEWWDPTGKFRPLHKFNPVRLSYIKRVACSHFNRDEKAGDALSGLSLLDVGCGGGLLCEPMFRLGAKVTGIDPSERNIAIASSHGDAGGLKIDYQVTTVEALEDAKQQYDIVLNMEVVEHVADVEKFIVSSASLVKSGGIMLVATLNRTLKAYMLAIVGAEYVLRWLPRGTHQWEKFVTPGELRQAMTAGGLVINDEIGVGYNPFSDEWSQTPDMDVNYMMLGSNPQLAA